MINRMIELPRHQHFFLFGPRQTGKSTLLRSLFSEDTTRYYDLLKSDEYLRLSSHPEQFRAEVQARPKHISHIVIDEVQRIPLLLNEVHHLIEQPNPPWFILTGSSARSLKRTHANLLAGRALTYHLYPLTAQELGEQFQLQRVLQYGALPSVSLETDDAIVVARLRSYIETYVQEEIEQEAQLRQIGGFIRFLAFAAASNGQQINYSNISRHTGVSAQAVRSYFQILEDTLLGNFLYPYVTSTQRQLTKQPKFYFFDCGVVRAAQKQLSVPLQPSTPAYGDLFEQFVMLEMMHLNHYRSKDYRLSYYRTRNGAEVDCIIETPDGQIIAVEIKSGTNISLGELRGLTSFAQIQPQATLYCVAPIPYRRQLGSVTIIPWQEFLEEVFL